MTIDQPRHKGHTLSRSDQSWHVIVRTSTGHEQSCCFCTILLPGPSSSAPAGSICEEELCGNRTGILNGRNLSVVSALIPTSRLPRFRALVSSISTPLPAISDPPPHAVRVTQNKGLGMFARRDIRKGELIVWERPALIVPGLERNEDTSQEAYRLITEGLLEFNDDGIEE